jgi:hypothetical protein
MPLSATNRVFRALESVETVCRRHAPGSTNQASPFSSESLAPAMCDTPKLSNRMCRLRRRTQSGKTSTIQSMWRPAKSNASAAAYPINAIQRETKPVRRASVEVAIVNCGSAGGPQTRAWPRRQELFARYIHSDSGLLRTTLHSFMHGEAMAHQVWLRQHVLLQRRIDPIEVDIRDKSVDAGIEAHRLRAKHEAAVA